METNVPPPPPPLTWRDGAVPLLAIALAWLFWTCFGPESTGFPHLGVLALVCAHFAAVLLVLGKRARLSAGSILCLAAALALGLSCALYDSAQFLLMNCFVILLVAAMATFALSGHLSPGQPSALWGAVRLSFAAFFTRLGRPFRALGQALRGNKRRSGAGVLAVLIALPVVAVVLWLLSSADAVFSSIFDSFEPPPLSEDAVLRTVRVLILALFLCSALYFIQEDPPKKAAPHPAKARRATLFLPVTALLDIIYIIFCYVQIKYLFGGAEEASMAGGWAEYARSGFFQLVTITIINLGLFLLGADESRFSNPGGKLLRSLSGLLLALTALILVSAFWRMRLYIHAFGLSVLRLLTLWAMAAVCFSLLAAAWKLARPRFGFFRAAGTFALVLWCALNLAGPGRMIADYNVDKYLSGQLEQVDIIFLSDLGDDARPALSRLEEHWDQELPGWLKQDDSASVPWAQQRLIS